MALENDYDIQWDEFLDAYSRVKGQNDQLHVLIMGLIDDLEDKDKKESYSKALKEIINGESIEYSESGDQSKPGA